MNQPITRRAAIGRLLTLTAGAVALAALPGAAQAVQAPPPIRWVVDGGPAGLAAMYISSDDGSRRIVWRSDAITTPATVAGIERWAEQHLVSGRVFGLLTTEDPAYRALVA